MSFHRPKPLRDESGFTMVAVLMLLLVGMAFALAAFSTTQADTPQSGKDRDAKQAYAAAEAGINYYMFRLGQNNAYWTDCAGGVGPVGDTNPVNLDGASTLNWRNVQGTQASYAIELIPANGAAQCLPGAQAPATMIDAATGTMQIRSTGRYGNARRSVVATLRRSGFLDYLYFTNYETEDPQVNGGTSSSCAIYRRAVPTRPASCSTIVFGTDDAVKGPFHTNDDFVACGTPDFGRSTGDKLEVSAPPQGWSQSNANGCGAGPPNFSRPLDTNADILSLPSSNSQLQNVANSAGYVFTGTTQITFSGSSMSVVNNNTTTSKNLTAPFNGVIYVKSAAGCSNPNYGSPQTYNEPACVGNVYIKGSYSNSVTIGAERDIIVTDNLTKTGNAMMGLIPNGFARVYHPMTGSTSGTCGAGGTNATTGPFGSAPSSTGLTIDAAILTIGHSFIVDNYKCGAARGPLKVTGAIGQQFRGPVGTTGGTGYIKDYNYDDRFRVANPPYFLDPVQSSWRKIRYSEQVPARQGGG
jgi:Tfp pilus assembly protein PilX